MKKEVVLLDEEAEDPLVELEENGYLEGENVDLEKQVKQQEEESLTL